MPTATLNKWGNGAGVLIPQQIRDRLDLSIGDKLTITDDHGVIVITPQQPQKRYSRTKKLSIEQLFSDYDGKGYEPPEDWPSAGHEVDWGAAVGEEAW